MDPIAFLIIFVAAALGGALSFFTAKTGNRFAFGSMWGLYALVTAAMTLGMFNASGWDALGYLIVLLFGCAPAGIGMLIGSIAGRQRRMNSLPYVQG